MSDSRSGSLGQFFLGCLLPLRQARPGEPPPSNLRWIVHIALLALILFGVFLLHKSLGLEKQIVGGEFLRSTWLPLLFLLLYVLGWLIAGLLMLVGGSETGGEFPDIDAAWNEAMQGLRQANVNFYDLPLFLILGKPEGEERLLFQAAQSPLRVKQAPANPEAPIHVYATNDAVFVMCSGASPLGLHADVLAGNRSVTDSEGPGGDGEDVEKTMRPNQAGSAVNEILEIRTRADRESRQLTDYEKRLIRAIHRRDNPKGALLRHPDRFDLESARLEYFCRLMARERNPVCALNGVLLLIPSAGTDLMQDAIDTGNICQRELSIVRAATRVQCPVILLVCDFETLPGFPEFIDCFNEQERKQRVGQRAPLVPDFGGGAFGDAKQGPVAGMLTSLSGYVCNSVVPGWVYKKFRIEEDAEPDKVNSALKHNSRLFLLGAEMHQRRHHLGVLLSHAVGKDPPDPPLIGGCYVAGTGRDSRHGQAFVAGVLRRLIDEQNCVAWTDDALVEDQRYRQWASMSYVGAAASALLAVGLLAYLLFLKGA